MLKTQKMLVGAMARLDDEMVVSLVKQGLLLGVNPHVLMEEVRSGMERVGESYIKGDYFLADLIMASEIFQTILTLIMNQHTVKPNFSFPPIIVGTVAEDIHDIGKNITIGVLRYNGFAVHDLGVDVAGSVFVEAVKQTDSRMICLIGMLTTSYDSMKKTIQLLDSSGLRPKTSVMVGGLVNEAVRIYTGADYWSNDCANVSELCKRILFQENTCNVDLHSQVHITL
jgi:methanogenic corrinoid protein MtbC1